MNGWKVGIVNVARFVEIVTVRGLVRSPWGIFREDLSYANAHGDPMRWNLTHSLSGRHVCFCRTPQVAMGVAADLELTEIDWTAVTRESNRYGVLDGPTGARLVCAVVARWGSEGDVHLTDGTRQRACEAAGLAVAEQVS